MRTTLIAVAALALAVGACGKDEGSEKKPAPKPTVQKEPPVKKEPPKPLTAEQKVDKVKACWAAFDGKKWDEFAKCYAPQGTSQMVDAIPPMKATGGAEIAKLYTPFTVAFPDVKHELGTILVNGNNIALVYSGHGTNSGEMMGMPPTNKKSGTLSGQVLTMTDTGEILTDDHYIDMGTIMGHLGLNPMPVRTIIEPGTLTETVVIATDSETERANVELAGKAVEAYNAHDSKALSAMYADDGKLVIVPGPEKEDATGPAAIKKGYEAWWKMVPDVKDEVETAWGAGDYVVAVTNSTGTLSGKMPDKKMKATGKAWQNKNLHIMKIADGKIAEHWLFFNGHSWAVQVGLAPDPTQMGGGAPAEGEEAPAEGE